MESTTNPPTRLSSPPPVTPIVAPMLIPVMNSLVSQNEVMLERPELPDLSKSGPPEPMDDTPPSPRAMENTTNPPTPSAAAELSSPPTPAAMQVEGEGLSKSESTTMLCESAISGQIEDPLALNVQ